MKRLSKACCSEDLERQLAELSKTHPETFKRSFSGIPFNVFEARWGITATESAYLRRIDKLNYPFDTLVKIRLTLSDVATTKSSGVACNVINLIGRGELPELDISSLKKIVAKSRKNKSDVMIKNIKTFVLRLCTRYPEYSELKKYIQSVKIRDLNKAPNIYDPERGAYTRYEITSLASAINVFSRTVRSDLNHYYSKSMNSNEQGKLRTDFSRLIYQRLSTLTTRRLVQILMLKWRDLSLGSSKVRDEFVLRMPMAKQGEGFRARFEDALIPLDNSFSNELISYKNYILDEFYERLCLVGVEISKGEYRSFSDDLPILMDSDVFNSNGLSKGKIPKDKSRLLSCVGDKSTAFHKHASLWPNATYGLTAVVSDRAVNVLSTFGINRIRHTLGTGLASKGNDRLTISMALGNTPKSAGYYIDLLPEDRMEIDRRVEGLDFLANLFKGRVISEAKNPDLIISSNEFIAGESADKLSCLSCVGDRPFSCYGCNNFRPLVYADHYKFLRVAKERYERNKEQGMGRHVLAPLFSKITDIEATIQACSLYLLDNRGLPSNLYLK